MREKSRIIPIMLNPMGIFRLAVFAGIFLVLFGYLPAYAEQKKDADFEVIYVPKVHFKEIRQEYIVILPTRDWDKAFVKKNFKNPEEAEALHEEIAQIAYEVVAEYLKPEFGFRLYNLRKAPGGWTGDPLYLRMQVHTTIRAGDSLSPNVTHPVAAIYLAFKRPQSEDVFDRDYDTVEIMALPNTLKDFKKEFRGVLRQMLKSVMVYGLICSRDRNIETNYCQSFCPQPGPMGSSSEWRRHCSKGWKK